MAMPEGAITRPTIYDVARQAGVSKSLVSLVLQGSPRVSEPRRAAVLAAIADLGYRPSRAATELASHRTKNVEVVIDDYRNLSFVGLLDGIRSELETKGYHLTVTDRRLNAHLGKDGQGTPLSNNLDGLVIAAEPDDTLLAGWNGPTVVAGWRATLPEGADLVANDDELGGRIAVDHLLALGHRNIAHLTGGGGPAAHRRLGFLARTGAAGIERRSTAGITERCQASWSWESSSDGGSRSGVSVGTDPSGSVPTEGTVPGFGTVPGARCSNSSSR